MLRDGSRKVFQCSACRHQASLIAGHRVPRHQAAPDDLVPGNLPDQSGQTGLSALALRRQLGVSYPTAWLIHHKLMQAMGDREEHYVLEGKVQVDDAYLGGERTGGKVGRGSENKVAFVAAVSLTEGDRPLRVRLTPVSGFTFKAVAAWAKTTWPRGSAVFSDGLACFGAVTEAAARITRRSWRGASRGRFPSSRVNTVLGNLKTSLSGCYHALDFRKYAARYLAAFCYRFNRRFNLRTLHQRLCRRCRFGSHPLRSIRLADVHC